PRSAARGLPRAVRRPLGALFLTDEVSSGAGHHRGPPRAPVDHTRKRHVRPSLDRGRPVKPEWRERLRRVSVAGQCALVLLGMAWAWFERPAPVIYILWKPGLTSAARQRAEADLGLRNPQPSNDSLEYELWVPT